MMWNGDWNGWAWLAMSVSMLVFWGLVIWGVVALVRSGSNGSGGNGSSGSATGRDAEQILRERFARGEIDVEEFERRREFLRR